MPLYNPSSSVATIPDIVPSKQLQSSSATIAANYSVVISNRYTIAENTRLTIAANGRLKII